MVPIEINIIIIVKINMEGSYKQYTELFSNINAEEAYNLYR